MNLPTATELRSTITGFDTTQQKILGSVITTMLKHHTKVRDREWITAQFTSAVGLALEFTDPTDPTAGLEQAQSYAKQQINPILNAAYALFTHVARDLETRPGFTFEDAVEQAMSYFAEA